MLHLFNKFWLYLISGGMLLFAAGSTVGDLGGTSEAGAEVGADSLSSDGTTDAAGDGGRHVSDGHDADADATTRSEQRTETTQDREEPEATECKGAGSARLKGLAKQAPELAQVFQKYPKIQEQFEATFRREAAFKEVFPTIAEARQMREHFPNGLSDVSQLIEDNKEVEALDKDFYSRDQEGNYPGHATILNNMFQDNREAAVALFRTLPKEWARLDPDSYHDVMRSVVGATLAKGGIADYLGEMIESAREAKQEQLAGALKKLSAWVEGFQKQKPQPTEDEQRLSKDRQRFEREKQDRAKEDGQRFHNTFTAQSRKLQLDVIQNHPAMKKLAEVKSISPEKRQKIADEIRGRMEKLLAKSPSFMRKLRPAYEGRNLQETMTLQKAAWAQPWLLNKMVREVLRVETPAMVESNREAVRRRAGAPAARVPAKAGDTRDTRPSKPYRQGGQWYKPDGSRFSTAEIMLGKHQE